MAKQENNAASAMMSIAPQQVTIFDEALIRRYDQSGPRYTSYPTALQFNEAFDEASYAGAARASNTTGRPLSLYFHLPYCATVCFYCACNKIITNNRAHAVPYLEHLHHEIALQAALFDPQRPVEQLHWGGGTPTFLSNDQMQALMAETRRRFNLFDDDSGEYSIEIDPREATPESIDLLRRLGFNRISMGVQDFAEDVQRAVNRIQSRTQTLEIIDAARIAGFKSINLDLIYGLPLQTPDSFAHTLEDIIGIGPDRLSVFNYAHLPHRFKTQRQIDASQLPGAAEKLAILGMTTRCLAEAGYVYIGMDHFAKPGDELARAQREHCLHRNFQGYSTHADCDLVALGITAIGSLADTYSQNLRTVPEYFERISNNRLAVFRGIQLSTDDRIRRSVIGELICHFQLQKRAAKAAYDVDFDTYFAPELERLEGMAKDGLLTMDRETIQVTPSGRLLIRNICTVFDRYLETDGDSKNYSRLI